MTATKQPLNEAEIEVRFEAHWRAWYGGLIRPDTGLRQAVKYFYLLGYSDGGTAGVERMADAASRAIAPEKEHYEPQS